jgi:signal transduction histidine kinase
LPLVDLRDEICRDFLRSLPKGLRTGLIVVSPEEKVLFFHFPFPTWKKLWKEGIEDLITPLPARGRKSKVIKDKFDLRYLLLPLRKVDGWYFLLGPIAGSLKDREKLVHNLDFYFTEEERRSLAGELPVIPPSTLEIRLPFYDAIFSLFQRFYDERAKLRLIHEVEGELKEENTSFERRCRRALEKLVVKLGLKGALLARRKRGKLAVIAGKGFRRKNLLFPDKLKGKLKGMMSFPFPAEGKEDEGKIIFEGDLYLFLSIPKNRKNLIFDKESKKFWEIIFNHFYRAWVENNYLKRVESEKELFALISHFANQIFSYEDKERVLRETVLLLYSVMRPKAVFVLDRNGESEASFGVSVKSLKGLRNFLINKGTFEVQTRFSIPYKKFLLYVSPWVEGKIVGIIVEDSLFEIDEKALRLILHLSSLVWQRLELQEKLSEEEILNKELARRTIDALERERREISYALHDDLLQMLVGCAYRVEGLKNLLERDKEISEELKVLGELLRKGVQKGRELITQLRPTLLDELGLESAIRELAKNISQDVPIEIEVDSLPTLPHYFELAIFRVAQEGLNNIRKHSQAERGWLRLKTKNGKIYLEIGDNGKGFNYRRKDELLRKGHLGLEAMRERVETLKGNFMIKSKKGRGTSIMAEIPLNPE